MKRKLLIAGAASGVSISAAGQWKPKGFFYDLRVSFLYDFFLFSINVINTQITILNFYLPCILQSPC